MSIDASTFVRSLSGAQAKIILVLLVERGGLTVEEISFRSGIKDVKTLRAACKELARSEFGLLVTQTGAHGKVTWFPSGLLLPFVREAYFDQNPQPMLQGGENPLSESDLLIIDAVPERGKSPLCHDDQAPERGKSPLWTGSIRLMIDESSSCSSSANGEKFPTLETILDAMSTLRGMKVQGRYDAQMPWESLSASALPEKTPAKLALAWVVKAYGDRQRLNNPVGMVLSRLKAFEPRSLPANWQERLPAECLQALGIATQPPLSPAEPAPDLPVDDIPEPPEDPPVEPEAPPEEPGKPNAFRLYEENIGPLTPMLADALRDAEKTYPQGWVEDAITIAVTANVRRWNYIAAVLKRWQESGRDQAPAAPRREHGITQRKTQTGAAGGRNRSLAEPVYSDADDEAAALAIAAACG